MRSRVMTLKRKLTTATHETKKMDEYPQMIKSIVDELALMQNPVSDEDIVIKVLNELNPKFGPISTALRACETTISYKELFDKLIDLENVLQCKFLLFIVRKLCLKGAVICKQFLSKEFQSQSAVEPISTE